MDVTFQVVPEPLVHFKDSSDHSILRWVIFHFKGEFNKTKVVPKHLEIFHIGYLLWQRTVEASATKESPALSLCLGWIVGSSAFLQIWQFSGMLVLQIIEAFVPPIVYQYKSILTLGECNNFFCGKLSGLGKFLLIFLGAGTDFVIGSSEFGATSLTAHRAFATTEGSSIAD